MIEKEYQKTLLIGWHKRSNDTQKIGLKRQIEQQNVKKCQKKETTIGTQRIGLKKPMERQKECNEMTLNDGKD